MTFDSLHERMEMKKREATQAEKRRMKMRGERGREKKREREGERERDDNGRGERGRKGATFILLSNRKGLSRALVTLVSFQG